MSLSYREGDDVCKGKRKVTEYGPSLTKQEFAKESDLNYLMKRYTATGILPGFFGKEAPVFADCVNAGSFYEATNRVKAAEEAFADLPAEIRTRFNNQPVELIEFLCDRRNRPEAEELGLLEPLKAPVPVPDPQGYNPDRVQTVDSKGYTPSPSSVPVPKK